MAKELAVLGTAAVLLAGCAGKMPQTAEEFRQMAPGAFMVQVQTVDVKRSPREIGETFRRRAPDCLNVTIRTTSSPARRPASRVACRCASSKYAGTVTTARRTATPSAPLARSASARRISAETSCAETTRSTPPACTATRAVLCSPCTTGYER